MRNAGMPCNYGSNCRRNGCTYVHEPTNLVRLIQALDSARHELLACVFNITCNELAQALVNAHRRGVQVRGELPGWRLWPSGRGRRGSRIPWPMKLACC
jgi:hypothetical protein